jgi:hypothetical protein
LTSRRDFRKWFKTKVSRKIKTTFGELGLGMYKAELTPSLSNIII